MFRPSTAPRWKIATSVLLPFVVAAFAILTKTFGSKVPPTRASPEDLRKKRLSIIGSPLRAACHPEPPEALEREARNAGGRSKDPLHACIVIFRRPGSEGRGSFDRPPLLRLCLRSSGGSG